MAEFTDLFSGHAKDYAQYRPRYPAALFEYLATLTTRRELAWDCATGNGQAAVGLAAHFERVVATDGSAGQIAEATAHPRVEYRVETAEETTLSPASVDLVTVAQALHWFRLDEFYAVARRVARPGGVLAVWCYTLPRVSPEVDDACDWFYREVTGPYWEPQRRLIDERFETIAFPFDEIRPTPVFWCEARWTLADYLGYVGTWSAVQRYRRERGADPLEQIRPRLASAWGPPETERLARSPIFMRVGRVQSPGATTTRPDGMEPGHES